MLEIKSHRGKYTFEFIDFDNISPEEFEGSFLVIDSKVDALYPEVRDSFGEGRVFSVRASEINKTLAYCEKLIKFLLAAGIKKNSSLVAVGGGVVQDITSFVASILYRGVEWKFIPTTLLAQADSCIGSKTSINYGDTKNVLGSFYPPKKVWCDINFLTTVLQDDIRSGIGEILHYYLIDNSEKLHDLIELKFPFSRHDLKPHILESLSIKKEMIERDEFDKQARRVFNYGHTFGHAIEVLSDYEVKHGSAVTMGMHIANYVSKESKCLSVGNYNSLQDSIRFNLPSYKIKDVDKYISILLRDKKNTKDSIVCILPFALGEMKVVHFDDIDALKGILRKYVATHA